MIDDLICFYFFFLASINYFSAFFREILNEYQQEIKPRVKLGSKIGSKENHKISSVSISEAVIDNSLRNKIT